jgi:hypothetical protein
LIINNRDWRAKKRHPYGSGILSHHEMNGWHVFFCTNPHLIKSGVIFYRRAILILPSKYVAVVDYIEAEASVSASSFLHFAKDHEVVDDESKVVVIGRGGKYNVSCISSANYSTEIYHGQRKPSMHGWVSDGYLSLAPSPCISINASMKNGFLCSFTSSDNEEISGRSKGRSVFLRIKNTDGCDEIKFDFNKNQISFNDHVQLV